MRQQRFVSILMTFFVTTVILSGSSLGQIQPVPQNTLPPNDPIVSVPTFQGLSPEVAALAQPGLNNALTTYSGNLDEIVFGDRADVFVLLTDESEAATATRAITEAGGDVRHTLGRYLVARIPMRQLMRLGANPVIQNISLPQAPMLPDDSDNDRTPDEPVDAYSEPVDESELQIDPDFEKTDTFTPDLPGPTLPENMNEPVRQVGSGSTVSQGVQFMNADAWQNAGVDGTGVRVGIIDQGFDDWSSAERGCSRISPRNPDGTFWPITGTYGDHGTNVAEIVCDVAPNSRIYPVHADNSIELIDAIDYLKNTWSVDVITISLNWWDTAHDGNHAMSRAVNDAVRDGIFFTISASNNHVGHYEGYYDAYSYTTDGGTTAKAHGFHNSDWGQGLGNGMLQAGREMRFSLTWNEWSGTIDNDFDLRLYYWNGSAWTLAASSQNDNSVTGMPYEFINYTVPAGASGTYELMIFERETGGPTPWLQLIDANKQVPVQYHYDYSSVATPGDAALAFTVAASHHATGDLMNYSGRGPSNNIGGTPPNIHATWMPDIAGPTNVSTSLSSDFGGTSAAAPHVGGAAALILDRFPAFTTYQIEYLLENLAEDQWTTGPDRAYGTGNINLVRSPYVSNDHDFNAAVIDTSYIPGYRTSQLTAYATTDPDDALPSDCTGSSGRSVWYRIDTNRTAEFNVRTVGSGFDTVIRLFWINTSGNLAELECYDSAFEDSFVRNLWSNNTYYINISGAENQSDRPEFGNLQLSIDAEGPYNDHFVDAATLSLEDESNQWIDYASLEASEPDALCGRNLTHTVWYKYTPSERQNITVQTYDSNFDTVLHVYTGSSLNNLTRVDCNDDARRGSNALASHVNFVANANQTYYFQIGGYGGSDGRLVIETKNAVDLNDDGRVTPTDVIYIINRLGSTNVTADVNLDGTVDMADVDAVRDMLGN